MIVASIIYVKSNKIMYNTTIYDRNPRVTRDRDRCAALAHAMIIGLTSGVDHYVFDFLCEGNPLLHFQIYKYY